MERKGRKEKKDLASAPAAFFANLFLFFLLPARIF
jgi:hypothetical protein